MTVNNSTIIIIIIVAFVFFLIYTQNKQPKLNLNQPCQNCHKPDQIYQEPFRSSQHTPRQQYPPINIAIDNDNDPYSDPIKKQDLHTMQDPLTYPQLRLPRDILERYNKYYEENGQNPPINMFTQPMFDNPIINGYLVKFSEEHDPIDNTVPTAIPLFRVKSAKNSNRFFYYIIDQRYLSKIELKIPLDRIKVNNIRHNNADFHGLPELYDGDIIENIPIFPNAKFRVNIYKTYHFP